MVGEHDFHAGVREHVRQALVGIRGIERQVRRAGLEDAEDADHRVGRAVDADPHQPLRSGAHRAQVMRELVGPPFELRVCEMTSIERDRVRVRCDGGLRGEAVVQRSVDDVRLRATESAEPRLFRGVEERKVRQPALRLGDRGGEQGAQVPGHPGDGVRVEDVRGVLQDPRERAILHLTDVERQVHLRDAALASDPIHREAGEAFSRPLRRVLEDEHRLEHRRVAEAALRL
jgi:hypothetical protein